jgi:diguanylate cyclase (GGDEF)-like protein
MTRVLIVDDKSDNLYYLQSLLTASGYTVEVASHGAEALVKARQHPPQMIVSDLLMPVMDGYTLLRHWKADATLRSIPFIVYTATYTEPEDEKLALSLGADAFILKPSEPEDFLARFREVESKGVASEADISSPLDEHGSESEILKDYSVILIRKLEEKTLQLEEANKILQLDIARHKEAEDKIQHLAYYDLLTNLPNRRLLIDRLEHSLAVIARHKNHGAILFIDLDHFKTLNDTKGHSIGDLLLVEVAKRLQTCVRDGDTLARLGGDEFVVILEDLNEDAAQAAVQVEAVCSKIISAVSQPYHLDSYLYHSSASVGVCMFNNQQITVDELLKRADIAMYQAKSAGRNTLSFYDPAMQAALQTRAALEHDLRLAIEENQFKLYYQMQVDDAGKIHGAEVLIRWLHPKKGLIPPLQFIPLAEETGLILQIGEWVLKTACAQIKAWENNPITAHLQIAVNVSASQFHDPDFVKRVMEMIQSYAIQSDRLKLELTESLVLDNVEEAIIKMQMLKEIGVRFSMDDFGTGFSSLYYLTKLPLDQLKIDQTFVRNVCVNNRDAVVVQTIIGMAHNLGMEVIAEGVELEEQRKFLEQHQCHLYQGYLFSKPLPLEEFESKLSSTSPSTPAN